MVERIVMDTNVFVSALRSADGASFALLSLLGQGKYDLAVSEPLIHEYEDAAKRDPKAVLLPDHEIDKLLDDICRLSVRQWIFFTWRPQLKDSGDEHVLDLAVAARCRCIVTYNKKDFAAAKQFGIEVIDPRTFLERIGELP
jgi:putative PIN family toxin of toxin-antitoxin system